MPCIKHSDAKLKFMIAENRISSSTINQTPLPQGRRKGYRYVRIEQSSPIQFRLFEFKNGRPKLSKERIIGENLHVGDGGMLILTSHPVPDEGFMLLTLPGANQWSWSRCWEKSKRWKPWGRKSS